ncbi:MAG: hypothetical protein HY807_00395 [Nitrospirae bacterium]|nr:hypothetical protein [Nitrospirota bacterium]
MRSIKLLFLFSLLFVMSTGCATSLANYEGSFKGKVIDADTGKPIEKAVVLGTWYKEYATVAGAIHKFYDASETLTDQDGEFSLSGQGISMLSNVNPMDILIFKAGYSYESGSWNSLKKYATYIKWEGNKAIIPLKKLTMEERKRDMPPLPPGEAPYEKVKLMLDESNKNSKDLGIGIIDIWRDKR